MLNKRNIKKILIMFSMLAVIVGFFIDSNYGISSLIVEKIQNETPEAKITSYIQAVSNGDKEKALSFWEISESYGLSLKYCDKIKNRGEQITKDLIKKKIKPEFVITNIEWWSTCCMPSIIDNPRFAGKAKVYVRLTDSNNIRYAYIFDVIVPRGYEGGLSGHSVRHWVLYDVYPEKQKLLNTVDF
ncbi:hypothetical protein GQ568_01520 [Patescibacteria group bacterium]|nr:hypothetical protein [Patescibacteria group bacterium]